MDMDLSMFRLMLLSDEMTDISADLKKFDDKDCCSIMMKQIMLEKCG